MVFDSLFVSEGPDPAHRRMTVTARGDARGIERVLRQLNRLEVTSPQAFAMLRERGLPVLHPERSFATADHIVPTDSAARPYANPLVEGMMKALEQNAAAHGIRFFGLASGDQGIVHVIGPEPGLSQPGMTIACGDSHTSTHGALGAIAFGFELDAGALEPMVTWGINPGQAVGVGGVLPEESEPLRQAYAHTGFTPGAPVAGTKVDVAFIGSCTNGRRSDLREAARVARGRVCASSSNRNFIGRQGSPRGRTLLMSPAMVAAAAVRGAMVDVREVLS